MSDEVHDNCGLSAAIHVPNAARVARDILLPQQPRGERGCGFVTLHEHKIHYLRKLGLIDLNFPWDFDFKVLPGPIAVGHTRYATKGGANDKHNVQPLVVRDSYQGEVAIAHNGTLVNADSWRRSLLEDGAVFQSTTDSELLLQDIARSKAKTLEEAILEKAPAFPPAFSLLVMSKEGLYALRDRYGVRPLSIAAYGGGYLLASETAAFSVIKGAKFIRDVEPGEIVAFDAGTSTMRSIKYADPLEHICIFEAIYFSNPRSKCHGRFHEDFRKACGAKVYLENKDYFDGLAADCVVPILDGGKHGAIGFSKASGVPNDEAFQRCHNAPKARGRSYTAPTLEEREQIAYMKLDLREDTVKDKIIITIDDSCVRATTARINNKRLRDAGAKKIINVLLSPPITDICTLGMDHQDLSELVAYRCKTMEEIARAVGADKVVYLSQAGLAEVVKQTYACGYCDGCFGGTYPPGCI